MISRHNVQRVAVHRVRRNSTEHSSDTVANSDVFDMVAVEEPLEIRLAYNTDDGQHREQSVSVTMRTPGNDFELAAGFLVGEGILHSSHDIVQMRYCVDREKQAQDYNVLSVHLRPEVRFDPSRLLRNFYTTSSCGVCGKASLDALEIQACPVLPAGLPRINAEALREIDGQLREQQSVFQKTGGLHAAALFDTTGNLKSVHEDVGRHNAVDKVIGERFLEESLPLNQMALLVSGRTSFEIMQKALMAGIPIVAAVGAPSSLSIDLAHRFGMTLLGFVRGGNFNIYAGAERIAV